MRIFFVLLTHIDNLPPAKNILKEILKTDNEIFLLTMYSDAVKRVIPDEKLSIIDFQKQQSKNKFAALLNRIARRVKLRKFLKKCTSKNDVIWTFTDYDCMECGRILFKRHHIMQLMELIKDIPIFDEIPFIKAHLSRYGKHCDALITCNLDRSFIQQVYWGLDKRHFVIPNKPDQSSFDFSEYLPSDEVREKLEEIKNKKIILYQGTFGYERKLDEFIEAVHMLGDDYSIVLMGSKTSDLLELKKKYPYIVYVPFISAPNHLYVSSKAHIGILSYVNFKRIKHFDPLNAVYCAPNKLFEYSYFGIPMIGNFIPGLNTPFKTYGCGECSDLSVQGIADVILKIEKNYENYSQGSKKLFESYDLKKAIENVIDYERSLL